MTLLPRPGDLTVPFAGGPVGLYLTYPKDDVIVDIAHDDLTTEDGMVFVLAHVGKWLYVMTSSLKLGWVYQYDVGPGKIAGEVYYIER